MSVIEQMSIIEQMTILEQIYWSWNFHFKRYLNRLILEIENIYGN